MGSSSFLMGALSGVAGGLDKYGQIQEEQRKYNMGQNKIKAEKLRRENFARFQYDLQQKARGSGMVSPTGQEFTKGEMAEMDEGGRSSAISKFEFQEKIKNEADGKKISQEWVKVNGDPISKAEAKVIVDSGDTSSLMNRQQQVVDRESRLAKMREDREATKASTQSVAKFDQSLNKVIARPVDKTIDSPFSKVQNVLDTMQAYQEGTPEYQAAVKKPSVQNALRLKYRANLILDKMQDGDSEATVKAEMKKVGKMSDAEIKDAFDYLAYTGAVRTSDGWFSAPEVVLNTK